MAEAASKTKTWVVIITLLGLSAVMAYLFTPAGEATWGEPDTAEHPEEDEDVPAARPPEIGPHPDDRTPEPVVTPRRMPSNDAGPPAVPVTPETLEDSDGEENAPVAPTPHVSPHPVILEEQTPEREHSRAVFFRDLLARRVEDTRAEAAAARLEGNPNRAARLERQADRLAAELPRANEVEAEHAARAEAAQAEREGEESEGAGEQPDWWEEAAEHEPRQW